MAAAALIRSAARSFAVSFVRIHQAAPSPPQTTMARMMRNAKPAPLNAGAGGDGASPRGTPHRQVSTLAGTRRPHLAQVHSPGCEVSTSYLSARRTFKYSRGQGLRP